MANEFRDYTIDIISVYTVYTRYQFENSQKFIILILNGHVALKCEILSGKIFTHQMIWSNFTAVYRVVPHGNQLI